MRERRFTNRKRFVRNYREAESLGILLGFSKIDMGDKILYVLQVRTGG